MLPEELPPQLDHPLQILTADVEVGQNARQRAAADQHAAFAHPRAEFGRAGDWRRYSTLVCAPGSAIFTPICRSCCSSQTALSWSSRSRATLCSKRKDRPPP